MKLFESRKYRLTGLTPLLGSQPASESIRTQYVAAKAPDSQLSEEERDLFEAEQLDTRGLSVFARDPDNDERLILLDYMVRGFFKAAFGALQSSLGVKAHKSKVDKYLFVAPRRIAIMRDGEPICDEDAQFERTLRADTPKGPRTGLQASEMIDLPWSVTIELQLIPNGSTPKSPALTWENIEAALDYGQLSGLGQFRNGSFGRFSWERVEYDECI